MFVRRTWRPTTNSPGTPAGRNPAVPNHSLSEQLRQIGLCAVPAQLDDFLARAAKARWSGLQLLEEMARAEITERSRRSLERRMRLSGVKSFKPMADFDWTWPTRS